MAQRRKRVCRFTRLRDEQRKSARLQNGIAIAELGCDIEVDRHPRETFKPVFRDHACVKTRPAGDDRDALDVGKVEIHLRQRDLPLDPAEVTAECLCDDGRLFENLLLHEMAIIAFFDGGSRHARRRNFARDRMIVLVENCGAIAGDDHPVALFEISDFLGQRCERQRVRTEIGLALSITHD